MTSTATPSPAIHPTASERPLWYKRKSVIKRISAWTNTILILLGAFALMVPLAWMVSTSFKATGEVFLIPIRWIPRHILFQNFPDAINYVPFPVYYRNSVFVASLAVIGAVLSSSLVAYAFARLRGPGKNVLFIILLSTLMLPTEVTLVPIYLIFETWAGWIPTAR